MGDAGFYRGTNADQDGRFTDKEKKLLKTMKFEDALERKIDRSKIKLEVIKPWIVMRLTELLGIEDDVVTEFVFTQLEAPELNPKIIQINITGFLNARRAREFMGELWNLLIEAEQAEDGIPSSLIEKKLHELHSRDAGKKPVERKGNAAVTMAENDWKYRYNALSGGNYTGPMIKEERDDRIYSDRGRERPQRDNDYGRDRDRERRPNDDIPRRREREDRNDDRRNEDRRTDRNDERKADRDRPNERRVERDNRSPDRRRTETRRQSPEADRKDAKRKRKDRSRSRSRSRSPRRKFREGPSDKKEKKHHRDDEDDEKRRERKKAKKEKKKSRRRSASSASSAGS